MKRIIIITVVLLLGFTGCKQTKKNVPAETEVGLALLNPMQVFRTEAMMLFDPQLVLLGPSAYVILDIFGNIGYMAYALLYPLVLGTLCATLGFLWFRRSDLI